MEGYLRKYGWALQLGFVIIAAALLAVIASEIIGIYLAPYRVPDVDLSQPSQASPQNNPDEQVAPQVMARAIDQRCLFSGCPEPEGPAPCNPPCAADQICSDGNCVPNPNANVEQEPNSDIPVESTSGIKLYGVLVASNPRYSTAILQAPSGAVSSLLGVGDKIDNAEIKEIYRDRIILQNGGRLEFVRLDDSLQGNPSGTPTIGSIGKRTEPNPSRNDQNSNKAKDSDTVVVAAKAAPDSKETADEKDNIKRISLSKDEMKAAFHDPVQIAKAASIIPHYVSGRPSGVKIVSLRPPIDRLGLRSGDIIKSINGNKVYSQVSAFDAFSKLEHAKSVYVEIERGGKPESFHYTIK